MAITDTLLRLKTYFLGWHRANYRTIHDFTDNITEDDPDGSYTIVHGRAIKREFGSKDNPNKDTIWGNIGKRCSEMARFSTSDRYNDNGTLWENVCRIWANLGDWGDQWKKRSRPDGPLDTNVSDPWDPEADGVSIWGWVNLLWQRSKTAISKITSLESKATNLEVKTNNLSNTKWGIFAFHPNWASTGGIVGDFNWVEVQFVRTGNMCSCTLLSTRTKESYINNPTASNAREDAEWWLSTFQNGNVLLDTKYSNSFSQSGNNYFCTVIQARRGNVVDKNGNQLTGQALADELTRLFCPAFDTYMTPHNTNKIKKLKLYNTKQNGWLEEGIMSIECYTQNLSTNEKGPVGGTCTYVCSNRNIDLNYNK